MAFKIGSYSTDTLTSAYPLGTDYLEDTQLAINWDRGRAYTATQGSRTVDLDGDDLVTDVGAWGITSYNMTSGIPLLHVDLYAHFAGDFDPYDEDAVTSFYLLPKSYEGTGSDIIAITHTLNRTYPYTPEAVAAIETKLTLVNMDTGTVIGSYDISKRLLSTQAVPYVSDHAKLCNIGETPNNWYMLGQRNQFDNLFTLMQITTNGTTGSIIEHIVNAEIGFSGAAYSLDWYSTFRADEDGVSFWFADYDAAASKNVHYVKFPFPYATPVITTGVITESVGGGATISIRGLLYHKIGSTEYLVTSTVHSTDDTYFVRGYTFTDPTGSYTNIWETGHVGRPHPTGIAWEFFGENVESWQILSMFYNHNGYQKGLTSVLVHDWTSALPLDQFSILCVATGDITYGFDISNHPGFGSVKYDYEITQRSVDVVGSDYHELFNLFGRDLGGQNIICLGEFIAPAIAGLLFSEEWDPTYKDWSIYEAAN